MPDEPRRIVLEKSKTVRRRYQRSNQRFQFTASQIERLDREQDREKKAKQLREREKKRIAAKKRKAEQEARVREERKRRAHPDPNGAFRPPSSQPLLSMFLGAAKLPAAPTPASESIPTPTTTTTTIRKESHDDGGNTDSGSAAGDTEAESDAFDDLDEELEHELSELDAGVPETAPPKNEDEFSDCSAFNEDIMKQSSRAAAGPLESSFGGSFQYDPADFLEAEAAITQKLKEEARPCAPSKGTSPRLLSEQPHIMPTLASLGESFRDETADWIEQEFAQGTGDPFWLTS